MLAVFRIFGALSRPIDTHTNMVECLTVHRYEVIEPSALWQVCAGSRKTPLGYARLHLSFGPSDIWMGRASVDRSWQYGSLLWEQRVY
jgi:hypothetical protein